MITDRRRKKSCTYGLSELIMGAVMMYMLRIGSRNIDILSINEDDFIRDWTPNNSVWSDSDDWEDFVRGDFFDISQPKKDVLLDRYKNDEEQLERINEFWSCRVFGITFEEAALRSMNIDKNTVQLHDQPVKPDGLFTRRLYDIDNFTVFHQPNIVEVKAKTTGTGSNVVFNYSSNTPQFDGYRNHLKSPTNTAYPIKTVSHGLFMVLPSDVGLSEDFIINKCSQDKIPLFLIHVQKREDNNEKFRIKKPELVNVDGVSASGTLGSFLGDSLLKYCLEKNAEDYLKYRGQ